MSQWTPWDGTTSCPINPDFNVQVRFRDGTTQAMRAGNFYWKHHQYERDIIAYRVQHDSLMTEEEAELTAREHRRTAESFLNDAASIMAERGKQYDQPGGERSMGKAVAALNAITGRDLTEAEGWLLLSLVKRVRQFGGAGYHQDSAEDAVAYAALEAEALEANRATS